MLRETQYSLKSGQIHALEYGNAEISDISIIFLHGWLDNAASFLTILSELASSSPSIHLCAIDLPGHGHSEHKIGDHFYPFHDYIDDVYQVLANLSPNKRVLVGHSLGALIASCYSAAFPEQVAGLVQIEGNGPLAESPLNSVKRLRDGVISRQRIRRKPLRAMTSIQDAIERRAKVNNIQPELIAPIVKRGLEQREERWYWRHDTYLQSDSLYRMSVDSAEQFRQQITCPQLVILGEEGFAHLQQSEPHTQSHAAIEVIAGGHHCHLQQSSRVCDLILGLVNKI
ncbi:alpha/beta hydrolase [Vibrio sinensis]|uniref:Alpha/beta hydrolase n=1 Tax=Vibrio sinensis TaxID=2302434 RepID=A0A3A6QN49_9VIBR|nr:alpha/beta hydrolase [Vibrio sinensis]RJX72036.1 alpha/beta hydrolase [Vibrio sinensis]